MRFVPAQPTATRAPRRGWRRGAALLGMLALLCAPSAQAELLQIGERQLDVPPPRGYVSTRIYHPELVRTFAAFVPPGARLLDVYLSNEDFKVLHNGGTPAMARTFQLQVLEAGVDRLVSPEGLAELSQALERGLAKPPAGLRFLGASAPEPWGWFHSVEATDAKGVPTTVAQGLVLVNHQLVTLLHFIDGNAPGAREAAEAGVRDWALALRADNREQQYLAEQAGKLDPGAIPGLGGGGGNGSASGSMAYTIGRALGIGLFVYIVWRLLRRRRS